MSSSLEVVQKLAKKGAPGELKPTLLENQEAIKKWLEGYLEETCDLAKDWCSPAWQTARDCDAGAVRDNMEKLGLDDTVYEMKGEVLPTKIAHTLTPSGTPHAQARGLWTQTRSIEKYHQTSESKVYPQVRGGDFHPWTIAEVPELFEMPNSQDQAREEGRKYLRSTHSEALASSTVQPAAQALANFPVVSKALHDEVPSHSFPAVSKDWMLSRNANIRPAYLGRGTSFLHTTDTMVPRVPISPIGSPRLQERKMIVDVEGIEARRWREHEQRVKGLLQRLEEVQQKYRGVRKDPWSSFETEPHISSPIDENSNRLQLYGIGADFDNQVEAIETLEKLHLGDRTVCLGRRFSPTFSRPYDRGRTHRLTSNVMAGYGGDAGWIEMGNPT